MNLFKKSKKEMDPIVKTSPGSLNLGHPFYSIGRYVPLTDTEIRLYSSLREAVPIIDAAICKLVRLLGEVEIRCEDKKIEKKLSDFLTNVKVNSNGIGISCFLNSYFEQLLTYGTSIGEIVPNSFGNDIYALYNANLEDVELKVGSNPLEPIICKKGVGGQEFEVDCDELILVSALNPVPGSIYGTSILKGLPFVTNILLNIYNSIGLNWERVGNVRFAVTYKPGSDSSEKAYARERASQIANEWSKTMQKGSGINDFISVGDVSIKVIGADNQILDSEVPVRQMLEQIIAKLSLPPFFLGVSWSTTERMSTQQVELLSSELDTYRRLLNPIVIRICKTWMRLNACFTEFEVDWKYVDLKDKLQSANIRLTEAKAMQIEKEIGIS